MGLDPAVACRPGRRVGNQAMDKIKPLFTATATATGGRNGHTQSSDGMVSVDLSVPKEMGGLGRAGTATPEHLFAARAMRPASAARWTSLGSSTRRMPARQRSRPPCRSGRARAAASGSPSNYTSRTKAYPKVSWRRSPRKRTKKSAPIPTPHAATWTYNSKS
jgi:hypothetical protein